MRDHPKPERVSPRKTHRKRRSRQVGAPRSPPATRRPRRDPFGRDGIGQCLAQLVGGFVEAPIGDVQSMPQIGDDGILVGDSFSQPCDFHDELAHPVTGMVTRWLFDDAMSESSDGRRQRPTVNPVMLTVAAGRDRRSAPVGSNTRATPPTVRRFDHPGARRAAHCLGRNPKPFPGLAIGQPFALGIVHLSPQ
jgi:hypothetical protein